MVWCLLEIVTCTDLYGLNSIWHAEVKTSQTEEGESPQKKGNKRN